MQDTSVSWGRFEWRAGAESYSYEIEPGGLLATLRAGGRAPLTLPVVAWDGLIEALKTTRKSRNRATAGLPPRAGSRWSEAEALEVTAAFAAGVPIGELARQYRRTESAIEHQLVKAGLLERRFGPPPAPPQRSGPRTEHPGGEAEAFWEMAPGATPADG